jgi:hypothetical protein
MRNRDHCTWAFLPAGFTLLTLCASCSQGGATESQLQAVNPQEALIARGRDIFLNETFNGNGRTCATCHREEDNFTIDPAFIATLPPDDPLFVAEFNPDLKENFENPRLMREFGLILENQDGFNDLAHDFNMRGVPHVLAQRTSIDSPQGPRTGWSGDGAPGDHTLRSFAVGAIIQHFTKTLNRVAGVDFRLPTDEELDALEAFQLSLGRQQDLQLPLPLKGTVAKRGQEIFLDNNLGKCNLCHVNAGATAVDLVTLSGNIGNANFDTGVEDLPDQPADLTGELVPPDDGFDNPGDRTFNVPPLVEAADTGPFFHNNSIETIEGAVGFYDGESFNNSPAGQMLKMVDPEGDGIELDGTQIVAIAAFLRVINALENIRESIQFLEISTTRSNMEAKQLLGRVLKETDDSIQVLVAGGLHPQAVAHLRKARAFTEDAIHVGGAALVKQAQEAIREQQEARANMVEP